MDVLATNMETVGSDLADLGLFPRAEKQLQSADCLQHDSSSLEGNLKIELRIYVHTYHSFAKHD